MKKITLILLSGFFSISGYAADLACPAANSTDSTTFCASFKASAGCHCTESGGTPALCQNMDLLYNAMIARFGSLKAACSYQKDTPTQTCIDDWTCYRSGGKDSAGRLCSSTGNKC